MKKIKLPHHRVNFVYSTDWHISARPPGRRQDDYQAAILSKVKFVRDLTFKMNGVALCGGDVFHVKNPNSPANSFHLLYEMLYALRSFPTGRIYGSVGNHDLSFDRMDTIPKQPLGILIASGAYYDLNTEPVLFVNEDESVRVSVETFPYEHGAETLQRLLATSPRSPEVTHRVGILHAYGDSGDGGSLYGEPIIGYNQIAHLDFDFMFWGHDHSRKETEQVGNITHINLGSLARAAFEGDELERPVVATLLSFAGDGVRYKEKQIPLTPLNIAFKSADKPVEDVSKSAEMKDFFEAMNEQVGGIQSTDPLEVLRLLCPEDDSSLLSLVKDLCEL